MTGATKVTVLTLSLGVVLGCKTETSPGWKEVEGTKYREVPYRLNDGTPCTIIQGGMGAGQVGVTCNYSGRGLRG